MIFAHKKLAAAKPEVDPAADISIWIDRLTRQPLSRRSTSPELLQQLQQTLRRPVDRILCIAADPDPTLDLLAGVFNSRAGDVRRGLELLGAMTGCRVSIVSPSATARLAYPRLHPSLLIRQHFNRRLRPHRLATDVGVLLVDAITAAELAAAERGESFELPIVIDDHRSARRHRFTAAPDAAIADLLQSSQIEISGTTIFHGPLERKQMLSLGENPPSIGHTELWLHVLATEPPITPNACTRCGECVEVCPVDLHPAALLEAAQADDGEMARAYSAGACIGCGLCTHVCPSGLPVMEAIRNVAISLAEQAS